jgi:UDP-GlcNAc3NAcA epimerase
MQSVKICTIVGARPQFIKARAVSAAIVAHNQANPDRPICEILVNTGQHYDYELAQLIFDELALPAPAHQLGVGSGSHASQTARALESVEKILVDEQPHAVLVYGDTNSTLAGALAAAKLNVPVAHVEAGMRCGRRDMAEEINRVLTDHISRLLFCTDSGAAENLHQEGVVEGVHITGDVMLDNLLHLAPRLDDLAASLLPRLGLRPREFRLATVHRAENTDRAERLRGIMHALDSLGADGRRVLLPLHPRTRKMMEGFAIAPGAGVQVVAPLGYLEMLALQRQARLVLTDSGGVQKEAYMQHVPCVTLREETEWVSTIQAGGNWLGGSDPASILAAAHSAEASRPRWLPLFGDGKAAARTVSILHTFLASSG